MVLWFMAAKRPVHFGVGFGRAAAKVSSFEVDFGREAATVSIFEVGFGREAATCPFLTWFWPRSGHGVHF